MGNFLRATAEELDVGFSLELQRLAFAQEGEMQQRAFMLSNDNVQKLRRHQLLHSCREHL